MQPHADSIQRSDPEKAQRPLPDETWSHMRLPEPASPGPGRPAGDDTCCHTWRDANTVRTLTNKSTQRAQLPPKAKGFTKILMFYDIFNTTCWRQPALKQNSHVRSLTYDLEALQKKIYYLFIIFTHMIGAELSEIFGFYKL